MIGIINTFDKRYNELIKNFDKEIIYSDKIEDFYNIDILILPLQGVDSFLFVKNTNINLMDIVINNNLKLIICGKKNEFLVSFCEKEKIKLISYLDLKEYTLINSKLTSEGLVKKILIDSIDALYDKKILILGYGYMGKVLYNYLKEFTKFIDIYARDSHDLKELYCKNIKINNLNDFNYDIIINTINFNIIDKKLFEKIPSHTVIYDIASYPYGFTEEVLNKKRVNIIPQIPSLYMPKMAGKVLYEQIKNIIDDN